MFVRRISVRNFRSIRNCTIEVGQHTAILGGNGAGKSTVLRALEKFYAPGNTVEADDFFERQLTNPIEIEITFGGLSSAETDLFASRVHDGEMSVARVFEAAGGRASGKYFGLSKQCGAFLGIRATPGAREKRQAYDALRTAGGEFSSLTAVTREAEIEPQLSAWEASNPTRCELLRDDGQFFGFSNVARGSLQKHTSFVFIPAVRDVTADAVDAKGAVVARLMELVVRSAIQRRADIVKFQRDVVEDYRRLTDPERLTELGDLSVNLTETLQHFYLEAAVNLKWREAEDFTVPLPSAEVLLDDDGFEGPVDRKGHGLQRAFILTLLQHLAKASAAPQVFEVEFEYNIAAQSIADDQQFVLPGLILAIEEPELYQHPTKQRHFSKVLKQLSDGGLPGVAAQTQVIFASHSNLFVSVDRFDEIRLARRRAVEEGGSKECILTSSTLLDVCRRLEAAFGEAEGTRQVEPLKSRLHVLGSELAEGFFADVVVLVEGASDRAALVASATLAGIDMEANGIAILPVTGKAGLAGPACIFQALGIPTFIIWDGDSGGEDPKVETNRALQRIAGIQSSAITDYATLVGPTFASFERDLEAVLRLEIGSELYDQCLEDARNRYALQRRRDAEKSPIAMTEVLAAAHRAGHVSATLTEVVHEIQNLRTTSRAEIANPVP